MSYNFGQYRYSGNRNDYLTSMDEAYYGHTPEESNPIGTGIDDYLNYGIFYNQHQGAFYDKILTLRNNYNFEGNETYYIRFAVRRSYGAEQQFKIGLLNFGQETEDIAIQKIADFVVLKSEPSTYEIFEAVFTPNQNFNAILFEYYRGSIDYSTLYSQTKYRKIYIYENGARSSTKQPIIGRQLNVQILQLAKLKNVIQLIRGNSLYGDVQSISKIGIQGPPGILLGINGQQIRIGGNGIYELNDDIISIDKLNIIPLNGENTYFIIDFEYTIE